MKNKKDVIVIVQARLSSQRCPRKMLRPFGDTTLLDIALDKLHRSSIPNSQIWCSVYEDELKTVCAAYPFNVYNRSSVSASSEGNPITEIFEWWNKIDAKYVIMLNACCPFLRMESIERFYDDFLMSENDAMFGVIEKKNYFWNLKKELLTNVKGALNTKTIPGVYEAAHILYGGSMEKIGQEIWMGDFGKTGDVELWSLSPEEALDIDEEWQFKVYEELYKQGFHL